MNAIQVLIVDDNSDFVRAAEGFLTSLSTIEVIGRAASGLEALDMVKRLHPTLVLMDLVMPGMDGLEATRQVKAQDGAPKVIIVSLASSGGYDAHMRSVGADGFVSKTAFTAQLPVMIESLFGGSPRAPVSRRP